MKVPYSWMAEFCDPGLPPAELAEKLAMTGTEVERVVTTGPADPSGFVVGLVTACDPHPDADRLSVCEVDTGDGKTGDGDGAPDGDATRTIVCGAPNVAADQTVIVALPGAVMPNGMKIKKAKLRGVASEGMICSADELGLGTDSDGIMVLADGAGANGIDADGSSGTGSSGGAFAPGTPVAEALPLGEAVLELEVTPNRTDCFSIYGVAREAHAITGADLAAAPWDAEPVPGDGEVAGSVSVQVEDHDLCPRFTARLFHDVEIGPSPDWLAARLTAAGQRPISNVVDITNYVMLLTGQPMHAFDYDLVPGGELFVRSAKAGEKVTTLDGIERDMDETMVLVCDREGPTSIAGVMGGSVSEVSDSTTSVLMEAATWNGPNILSTSRELALRSEASARFEKQLHPALTVRAQQIAARLMVEICGATPVDGMVDVAGPIPADPVLTLRADRVERVLGLEVPLDDQADALRSLGFGVEKGDDSLTVLVPPDRHFDVTREIDLVEEVGRVNDLDSRLPATLPDSTGTVGGLSRQQALQRRSEDILRENGFNEIVGWSFTDPGEVSHLRLSQPDPRANPVTLSNPLSEDQSVMRTTLAGSLLAAAQRNLSRGADRVSLFESGRVYLPADETGPGPLGGDFPGHRRAPANEPHHLAAIAVGPLAPQSWADSSGPVDFFSLKGVLERLAAGLKVPVEVKPGRQPFLHPGRSGEVFADGEIVGWIGQVHPAVAAAWGLGEAFAFEVGLAGLIHGSPLGNETYVDFTAFPPVDRDLAVVIPEGVQAASVLAAVREAGGELLDRVSVFDVYRGDQVDDDEKSLALRLRFRASDRTLSDDEVDPLWQDIVGGLEGIGGRLRG